MGLSAKNKQIINVTGAIKSGHSGRLTFGTHKTRCALGAAGIRQDKKEGDKATPAGQFLLRRLWYRPDRVFRPETAFPIAEITQKSGWCDAISDISYNRPISLPFTASHEKLWRRDGLYDVFFELGHNDDPPIANHGSAVFLHLQKNNFQPTLGCVAVSFSTMHYIIRHARPGCVIHIG